MKKRNIFLSALLLASAASVLFVLSSCSLCDSEADVIKANWGIKLPDRADCIYANAEEDNWFGEGDRFHVFDVGTNENGGDDAGTDEAFDLGVKLSRGKSEQAEAFAAEVAEGLGVPDEYLPPLGGEYEYYFTCSPEGDDTLAIFFADGKLYVAERFT